MTVHHGDGTRRDAAPALPGEGGVTKSCGLCGSTQSDTAQTCYRCGGDLSAPVSGAGKEKKGDEGSSRSRSPREPRARRERSTAGGERGLAGRRLLVVVLAVVLVAAVGVGLMIKLRGGGAAADSQASDSGSHSAIGGAMNSAKDAATEANTRMIMTAVETYIAENGKTPAEAQVTATGAVGQLAGTWPMNPYTKAPAQVGTTPGDYTYQVVAGNPGYELVGYGADGPVCTLP